MNDRKLILDVGKGMFLLLLAMLVCKYTKGGGAVVLLGIAFFSALSGRVGWAIAGYILFPFMVVMNPYVLPKSGATGIVLRLAPLLVGFGLMVSSATRTGRNQIPIGMIWAYLAVAAVCSIGGYCPMISYLKIVNCSILFVGLWLGFRNIDKRPAEMFVARKFLLVLVAFLVWGSVLMLVFMPGAAYMTSVGKTIAFEGMEAANAAARSIQGPALFGGITNQSQCLAIVLPCSMAWLACDMFFVERRVSLFHAATLFMGLPMVYMTRSRSAFLSTSVAVFFIYFYCLKKVNLRASVRRKLRSAMMAAGLLVVIACGVMEVRNQSISKWLRKTDDVAGDARGFGEAFTESRQGKIALNMADFRTNPMFGTGFQVTYDMRNIKGLTISAPMEKSILPLMVLGETGLVGLCVFILFVGTFFGTCMRRKYYCCMALMAVFMVTNVAEATFFSPGGVGGPMWVLCAGGGFIIDMIVLNRRRQEQFWAMPR